MRYLHSLTVGASLGGDSIQRRRRPPPRRRWSSSPRSWSRVPALRARTRWSPWPPTCSSSWRRWPLSGAILTLPGIAGMILTVGVGVDTNVLVFERIREELRHGKTVRAAVRSGFDRVWITVLDTHATALIAAALLFQFGTGPIKGFAVTLVMGLIANVFASYFVEPAPVRMGHRQARGVHAQHLTLTSSIRRRRCRGAPPPDAGPERHEHRHAAPVLLVRRAVLADQIALLELDGDQDVGRRRHREQQVRERHRRRHPEREEPADVQRMAHEPVRPGRAEAAACVYGRPRRYSQTWRRPKRSKWLMRNVRHEHQPPAEREQRRAGPRARPDRSTDQTSPPSGRHCQNSRISARLEKQHVRRALERPRHDARPALLEPRPRHDAVLHGEEREQPGVDGEGHAPAARWRRRRASSARRSRR